MRLRRLFFCFAFFLSLILPACDSADQRSSKTTQNLSKEEVLVFIKTYDEAWNTKKNRIVDSLYAPQYRYFTSVGGISSRARNLEILAADYYKITNASRTEIEITIDGNTAIVSSRWIGNGIWKGEPFNDNQRCGLVIQKQGKDLKLLSEHCVDISTEPSF
jgi:Domain of unknown function (DUF4440)